MRWKGVTSTSDSDNLPKIVSLHKFSLSLKTFQAISYSTYCRYFHIVICSQFILNSLTRCSNHRRINNTQLSDSSIQHLSVGSGQYRNLTVVLHEIDNVITILIGTFLYSANPRLFFIYGANIVQWLDSNI